MTSLPDLDLDHVRSRFPAFDPGQHGEDAGRHLENAGGSWPCRDVVDRLVRYQQRSRLQPGHPHPVALDAAEQLASTHERLAAWLGVAEDELHVGPSTTANTVVLAEAFRAVLPPGAAVVVTEQDHEANSGPWRRLAERGVEVRDWRVDPATGRLSTDGLLPLLDHRVELVAFPHVSNVVGEVHAVTQWCRAVHEVGAVAVVDAVAAAPHGLPDVPALGADVLLFSAYKTFGPHQGVMAVRRDLLDRLPNQGHFFNADQPHKRLVPAGPDHAQVAALQGVVDHFEALDLHHFPDATDRSPAAARRRTTELVRAHEGRLVRRLLAGLDDLGLDVVGPTAADLADGVERAPTVSVRTGRPARQVATDLGARGVWCAGSHFYAWRLCEAIGVDPLHGVLRLSLAHYTGEQDVDRALDALAQVSLG